MDRIIKVTGKGNIAVKPDRIRLNMNIEEVRETYETTLKASAQVTEILKDCFLSLGFEREALKTLSFNVDTEYESYQDKDRSWKKRFVGYKVAQSYKVEFDADNQLLGKVLFALAHCKVKPEFHIAYTVKDAEAVKNELLEKAVLDSKAKAEHLTKAINVKLGEVQLIDYSWGELEIISRPMNQMLDSKMMVAEDADCYDIDIEPDDINVTDTVTVTWAII